VTVLAADFIVIGIADSTKLGQGRAGGRARAG
jgi:hypothetical protein